MKGVRDVGLAETDFEVSLSNYIKSNRDKLISEWFDIVRHKSISSTGEGVVECCNLIAAKMRAGGIDTVIYPVKPYPVIFGRVGNDPEKKTVLIYAHYDVQPPEPFELWNTPPFEPTVIDGVAFARGISDNKAGLTAHFKAAEFWLREMGALPVNLKFIFEGCEENSSVGLAEFVSENRELLKADFMYAADGARHETGIPTICLGAKGLLSVELAIQTLSRDAHSGNGPILPNAAQKMVEILNKMKSGHTITIPGFLDKVKAPSDADRELMEGLPGVDFEIKHNFGAEPMVPPGKNLYEHLLYYPTFNINGLVSGYTGRGGKTIVPSVATAKIDMRLVPDQEPDEILDVIRDYITSLGYEKVSIRKLGAVKTSMTPADSPGVSAVCSAVRGTFGDAFIYPRRPSTGPDYVWTRILGIPAIQVRYADADSGNHAPNERLKIDTFLKGVELTARVIDLAGKAE